MRLHCVLTFSCKAPMSADPLLTDKEFEELDNFLMSERCGDESMTMDALHGMLTAIAVCPENISTEEWLPLVWGPDEEDAPAFTSLQEAARISELMQRLLKEISLTLQIAPKDFEPLFCEHEWKGKKVLDAESWAWGFMEGTGLREETWQLMWDSPEADLLRPIYLLGAEEIEEEEMALVDDPIKCHKLALEIESAVEKIYRYWRNKISKH